MIKDNCAVINKNSKGITDHDLTPLNPVNKLCLIFAGAWEPESV